MSFVDHGATVFLLTHPCVDSASCLSSPSLFTSSSLKYSLVLVLLKVIFCLALLKSLLGNIVLFFGGFLSKSKWWFDHVINVSFGSKHHELNRWCCLKNV